MKEETRINEGSFSAKTNIGKVRDNNEDRAVVLISETNDIFLAVADGMGGANKGDAASEMAIAILSEEFGAKKHTLSKARNKIWLTSAIKRANKAIFDMSQEDVSYQGMGTTLTCCLIVGDTLYLGNLGDSRTYLDDRKSIKQISEDETYAAYLVKTGQISLEEAKSHPDRHVLMNALGIYPSLSLQISILPYSGENVICCTDGLYNQVSDEAIHAIISTDDRADQKVNTLIGTANAAGGTDNVGIAYWECSNA